MPKVTAESLICTKIKVRNEQGAKYGICLMSWDSCPTPEEIQKIGEFILNKENYLVPETGLFREDWLFGFREYMERVSNE